MSAASVAVLAPLQNLVLPIHLVGKDSPRGYGLVISCLAVGVMSLLPSVPALVACAILTGIGAGPLPVLFLVLITERAPEDVRGRVLGMQNAVSMTAVPASTFLAGLLVEGIGLRETGVIIAVLWGAVSLLLLVVPAMRHLEPSAPDSAGLSGIPNPAAPPHAVNQPD
ncbi:MFS transporter [Streptomyces sp. MT29]|nr:MFS transporter [Streptomyces sp. MT29]